MNNLLKKATNGMKVTQRPIKPSAAIQQIQVIAPPKPPNNPASPPAPARSGGGNGTLKTHTHKFCMTTEKKKNSFHLLWSAHILTLRWTTTYKK